MNEGIHTSRCAKAGWHGRRHIRIDYSDNWNVMRVYANKFAVLFHVSDNIVDGNLCCRTGCSRHSDNRQARMFCRRQAFKTTHIAKFRICHNRSNSLTRVDSTATAYSNDHISTSRLTCSHTRCYIFNGWIRLNIVIYIVSNACRIKQIRNLRSNLKLK